MKASVLFETRTDVSFVAANGTVVRYQDYLEGINHALMYFVRNRMLPVEDLRNAAQDVAMRIWEIRETLSPRCKEDCFRYGRTSMVNRVRDAWRAASRGRGDVPLSSMSGEIDEDLFGDGVWADRLVPVAGREYEADTRAVLNDVNAYVDGAIDSLVDAHREVMAMRKQGFSPSEIGEALGCGAEPPYVRIHRAKKALAERLGEDFLRENGICA